MKKIFALLMALCLIAGLLPMAAMADEAATPEKYVTVKLMNSGNTVWGDAFAPGAETRYLTTGADGALADGTADNWNIKLESPVDGTPTLTLKGATIKGVEKENPLTIGGNMDMTVVVETDSTINTELRVGFYVTNNGVTTITGPGKLSIVATDNYCMRFAGNASNLYAGTVIIKDANLDLSVTGASSNRCAIGFDGGDLTIDNSKINIDGVEKALGIWGYAKYTKDETGKVTKVAATWKDGEGDVTKRNLTIQNGSVITGIVRGKQGIGANGNITIKDSTVELSVNEDQRLFTKKPIIEGEFTAVAGPDKESLEQYDEGNYTRYRYIKLVPGKVPLSDFGLEDVPTEPETEPTTTPTEPTTAPTEPVTVPTTEPVTTPTEPEATQAPTQPEATQAPTADSGSTEEPADDSGNAGTIILICVIALVVLAGAAAVVVITKKK